MSGLAHSDATPEPMYERRLAITTSWAINAAESAEVGHCLDYLREQVADVNDANESSSHNLNELTPVM